MVRLWVDKKEIIDEWWKYGFVDWSIGDQYCKIELTNQLSEGKEISSNSEECA